MRQQQGDRARGLALFDGDTHAALRRRHWRQPPPLTRRALVMVLALVLVLHALFALVLWHEMRPKPLRVVAMHMNLDQALTVRLLDNPSPPPAVQPPAPPTPPALLPPQRAVTPRVRPVTHEQVQRDAMVVQDHHAAPAAAASVATPANSLFAKDGSVHLPPTTVPMPATADVKAKAAKPADDRQIMQHDTNRMHYKATRFEKYFPPPSETAGGAVGRHVGDALKAIADSLCDPKRTSSASNMLCGAPPLPPGPKEGDERLNLPPAPLAGEPDAPPPPPLSKCIAEYNDTKPLSDGCPVNTPALAFKAEMRVCIDLYNAGKRLKTWCPVDTPDRAAAELKTPAAASSAGSH